MSIKEVLSESYCNIYNKHVGELFEILEKHLKKIEPNKSISYSGVMKAYRTDLCTSMDELGEQLLADTMKIINSKGSISILEREEINQQLEKIIKFDLYTKRFDIFTESISRNLARYGVSYNVNDKSINMERSLTEIYAKNASKKIKKMINNKIDVYTLNKSNNSKLSKINDIYKNQPLMFWILGVLIIPLVFSFVL